MKIAIYDSWNKKFTQAFIDHWEANGHEVKFNPDREQAKYADKVFFYQGDNGAIEGTKHEYNGDVYVQCVDIEVWAGQPSGVNWNKVKGAIFMAEHTSDMVKTPDSVKRTILSPGIDLSKFTLRPPVNFNEPIRRIAYVVGDRRIWDVKRFDIALQMTRDLINRTGLIWQLHVRGSYSSHPQYNAYCKHLEEDLDMNHFLVWTDRVDDMNQWLDDKDYFFLASTKEAFSYATGEAMAKGIKPIIGNWQSAKEVWGEHVSDTYGDMLDKFLDEDNYTPELYRKYVEDNHDQEEYFKKMDEFMEIN